MILAILKKHTIAALCLATFFVGATIAEAGLTGGARQRPGKGFHNRKVANNSNFSRSNQVNYLAPRASERGPVYHSAPAAVAQPQPAAPRAIYRQSWFGGRLFR